MNKTDGVQATDVDAPDVARHDGPTTTISATKVRGLFSEVLGVRVPDDDTDVIATGLLDSLGLAELLLTLESEFDITFDVATLHLDDVRSVRAIVSYLSATRGRVGT